ncbi:hypothetical protein CPC08DRAFT_768004 [Agrocybe pediades]|nr:hypothetical protein CPC08DRAFT_768004 [Agrocybe pediades]
MAIGILKQNGLSYKQIREMWKVADRNATGILSRNEVTVLIRLMGWVQAGKSVDTPFLLDRQGPLPTIRGINHQEESQSNEPVLPEPCFESQAIGQTVELANMTTPEISRRSSECEPDFVLEAVSVSPTELAEFEDIFLQFEPKEGCIQKRDVMAIYMDALPGLSFDQLYKIMRLLRGPNPGMVDFKSFVIGFYIIRSLETGCLLGIPTSISDEAQSMSICLTRQHDSPRRSTTSCPGETSQGSTNELELSAEAENDVLDLVKDIERMKCISGAMSMKFKKQYQVLPVELYHFWKESDPKFEHLINSERLAMMARLVRERLSRRSPEIPSAGISDILRNADPLSPSDQTMITPPPPQYRSRMYSTAAIAYNGVINEIIKLTQQFDEIIKEQEREHRVIREAHASLEREHALVKSRETGLQESLARKEIELKEAKHQLNQTIRIASEGQAALDECRMALAASNNQVDELQSTVHQQKNQLSDQAELQQRLRKAEADKSNSDLEVDDLRQILALKDIQILELHDRVAELSKGAAKPSDALGSGWPLSRLQANGLASPTSKLRPRFVSQTELHLQNKPVQVGNQTSSGTQGSALASPSHFDAPIRDFLRNRPTSLLMVPDENLQKHFSIDSRYLHTISEISIPDDTEEEETLADSKLYEQFLRDMDLLKVDVEKKGCVTEDVLKIFQLEYGFAAEDLAIFQKLALIKEGSPNMDDFKHAVSVIRDRLKEKGGPCMDAEGDQDILSGAASFSRVISRTAGPSNMPTSAVSPKYPTAKSGYLSAESEKARLRKMLDSKPVQDRSLLSNYSTTTGASGYLSAESEKARLRQLLDGKPAQGVQDSAVIPGGLMGQGILRFHIPKRSSQLVLAS